MKREHLKLAMDVGCKVPTCISYSQLKRIMEFFDYGAYNTINEDYFSFRIAKSDLE